MAAKIPPGLDPVLAKQALEGGKHWGASDQKRYDALVRKRNRGGRRQPPPGLDPELVKQAMAGSANWDAADQQRYNKLKAAKDRGGTAPQGNRNKGMFNFSDMMNKFYNWQPDATDDPAGAAIKNTFMSNAIQSAMNTQQAIELATANAGLATNQMQVAAGLEFGNKSAIMEKEFNYGMQKMGAEYDFQEQFAKNEANRLNNQLALRGDIQQNQTRLEGAQNRLNIAAQGRNDVNLQDIKGQQAMNQLRQQGFNDNELQALKTSGALAQIDAQVALINGCK